MVGASWWFVDSKAVDEATLAAAAGRRMQQHPTAAHTAQQGARWSQSTSEAREADADRRMGRSGVWGTVRELRGRASVLD